MQAGLSLFMLSHDHVCASHKFFVMVFFCGFFITSTYIIFPASLKEIYNNNNNIQYCESSTLIYDVPLIVSSAGKIFAEVQLFIGTVFYRNSLLQGLKFSYNTEQCKGSMIQEHKKNRKPKIYKQSNLSYFSKGK